MSVLRKLRALAFGYNLDMEQTAHQLRDADIPVSDAPCRGCGDPCDEGHDEYPNIDVDMETEMLGSVKPYGRQIVISSGKSDWPHDITLSRGTLAAYMSSIAFWGGPKEKKKDKADKPRASNGDGDGNGNAASSVAGVFAPDPSKLKRVAILNGSHRTVSNDDTRESVLVFPDYKVVTEVEVTHAGAEQLWTQAVAPFVDLHSVPRPKQDSAVRSWILPYSCVILLCSHKRRDNRCAISAPKLEHSLTLALEREGWEVHTQLEDPSLSGPALEDEPAFAALAPAGAEEEVRRRLQGVDPAHADHKRALILFCSHIGGHKYAGNVIIHTPRGVTVWYGRVTPHEVDAIVKETIVGGRILPALLRGGSGLCAPGRKSLNDW
ncbi:Sucraseferredoxin-like protein [Daedaleopsis nitida]|nr:Sucraseferredoxin-like protein [Daedaleopsis nitida]